MEHILKYMKIALFWLRNTKNNFQLRTVIWGLSNIEKKSENR